MESGNALTGVWAWDKTGSSSGCPPITPRATSRKGFSKRPPPPPCGITLFSALLAQSQGFFFSWSINHDIAEAELLPVKRTAAAAAATASRDSELAAAARPHSLISVSSGW